MASPIRRKIGDNEVFCIGYGAMGLSGAYNKDFVTLPDEERFKVLDAVFDSGCTYWDTADIYFDSEELLGKWFKRTGKRDQVYLASKFGFVSHTDIDGSPKHVEEAIEASLKKLDVECIDLYYLHRPDSKVPIEVTVGALAELVKAGKIKHIGLSECSASTLRRAHAVHPIAALQVEYSPFTLDIEDPEINVLKTARELGIAIVAYSPLGRGLLTGRFKSPDDFEDLFRKNTPRYSAENFPNILALVDVLKKIGEKHGATGAQATLAWLLAQGPDIIPIPGTSRIPTLKENVAAANIKLTDDELAEIRQLAEKVDKAHSGPRYPLGMDQLLFADTPELEK